MCVLCRCVCLCVIGVVRARLADELEALMESGFYHTTYKLIMSGDSPVMKHLMHRHCVPPSPLLLIL